ncbi:hypothetical protein [Vibrio sp. B1Z05]|uniref:hypothetical protein n=1 Tax=Vibrio sp. B1Z05 TaxID=2654980 RepID=UPI00128C9DA0|nr:hypothetical protein [Vibrio sp. B1Z05]MPW37478.1 hypothetical protein [Vibrio sp. B1Z05]
MYDGMKMLEKNWERLGQQMQNKAGQDRHAKSLYVMEYHLRKEKAKNDPKYLEQLEKSFAPFKERFFSNNTWNF